MIYQFPDLDTLRLAITSSVVPPEISLAPAVGAVDDDGHVWMQPTEALPKKSVTALRKLGVESYEANGDLKAEEVTCWLQMLPVVRDPAPPTLSAQAPVIFDLPEAGQLPGLVAEMLRLGNDRQGFRWLKDGKKERVLLRVIGPPYYSLLRAFETGNQESAPRAYVERSPGVWVELGHTHTLVEYLKPKPGKVLFLRPDRQWEFFDEGPFRDIYEILDFTLPDATVGWTPTDPGPRLKVPLRLAPAGGNEPAEMWVLRHSAFDQVDALVRNADNHLLNRLAFAVGEHQGEKSIVLRVRPSKQAPPVLVLPDAVSFRPFLKLPNLFMPSGQRLQPPLRRDAVRQLLADDPDRIVWLYPGADGHFTPESLPDSSFRPLHDWVEYVLDHDQKSLQEWIDAARFDFGAFVCKDDVDTTPKPPKGKVPRGDRKSMLTDDMDDDQAEAVPVPVAEKSKKKQAKEEDDFAVLEEIKPSELQQKLRDVQNQFLANEGPLDDATRKALWPEMASLNAALSQTDDAAICWLNAMWDHDGPPPDWVWAWTRAEIASWLKEQKLWPPPEWAAHWGRNDARTSGKGIVGEELDSLLELKEALPAHMRTLVSCILLAAWADTESPKPRGAGRSVNRSAQAIIDRLPQIQAFLEKWENRLGIRAVWLAWTSLARLSAGDVLSLAKARDRLLERLLSHGMNLEYDMPTFLRFSGQQSSERYLLVRDRVVGLQKLSQNWIKDCYAADGSHNQNAAEYTQAYKNLMFAFGLARLGEVGECHRLKQRATQALEKKDDVHTFLLNAFTYRVEEALAGRPHSGPLPPDYRGYLQEIVAKSKAARMDAPERNYPYFIDRLRHTSLILEPQEKIDPYRAVIASTNEMAKMITELYAIQDRQALEEAVEKLLKAPKKPWEKLRLMHAALELAPRLREDYVISIVARLVAMRDAIATVEDSHDLEMRAKLLERALFLAGHYDRAEYLQQLVNSFIHLLSVQKGDMAAQALEPVAGQSLRCLRKLGLREEIDSLLQKMTDLIMQGDSLPAMRNRFKAADQWVTPLRTLLHIASGWFYFGRNEQAIPILDEARNLLFATDNKPTAVYRAGLASTYAMTLGQAPVDFALKRFEELFKKLGPLADGFVTKSHYSRLQLQVIESVVLAVVSDDFAVGQNVRRWLDEDEYLVRSRIHRDLRAFMNQAGV
jgi:cellulose synthase operon protein C